MVLDRTSRLGVSRSRKALADPPGIGIVSLGSHTGPRSEIGPPNTYLRQHAMASVLCSTGDTGVLRRGTSREFPSGICDHRFLAFLGCASLGGRLLRTVHDGCRRLYVRSPWNGSHGYGAARYLPGHHSIFHGWRDRHDASPLFQRNSRSPYGSGRNIFGNGSDSSASTDTGGVGIHEVWGPVNHRPNSSASMGRMVLGGCRRVELLWR